jgi:hypothetical protein
VDGGKRTAFSAPIAVEYLLAGHGVHGREASTSLYQPAGQIVQLPSGNPPNLQTKMIGAGNQTQLGTATAGCTGVAVAYQGTRTGLHPARQVQSSGSLLPAGDVAFVGQSRHVDESLAATTVENLSAEQSVHAAGPMVSLKDPAGQACHIMFSFRSIPHGSHRKSTSIEARTGDGQKPCMAHRRHQ